MEEPARLVIQILIDHDCEVGIDIANAMAQVWFTEAGLDYDEYIAGLTAAADNGWIIPGTHSGTIQITPDGSGAVTGADNA
jgi:hypothetical protein